MSELLELLKSALSGAWGNNVGPLQVILALCFSIMIAVYIYCVYALIVKKSFYSREYAITLVGVCLITTVLVITIQFSLLVSLSVGGALSIVRFRTAIKSSLDMMFLFWSIAAGIMCGTGVALYALIMSTVLTIIVFVFIKLPVIKTPLILILNTNSRNNEEDLFQTIKEMSRYFEVKAKNATKYTTDYTIELRSQKSNELVKILTDKEYVESVSLLTHNGDIHF
ncbi:MAG: DUF4956 domain-containing protein [Erysipelotrichaceae bacterium]|nr:DUF4956 domain-containing protein [Erysipelotrichaceae bacterium]